MAVDGIATGGASWWRGGDNSFIHSTMGGCLIENLLCTTEHRVEMRGPKALGGGHQRSGRWTLLPMTATQIEVNRGPCRLGKRVATPLGVDPGRLLFPEPCYFSMGQISGADMTGDPGAGTAEQSRGRARPTASNGERGKGVSMWGASLCLVMLLGWREA